MQTHEKIERKSFKLYHMKLGLLKLITYYIEKDMEREELISRKLLDAQNELNNSLNCAPAYYSHKRIQEAFSTLKYWLNKRLAHDTYSGKVDHLSDDRLLFLDN